MRQTVLWEGAMASEVYRPCYVYAFEVDLYSPTLGEARAIKIGKTTNWEARSREYKVQGEGRQGSRAGNCDFTFDFDEAAVFRCMVNGPCEAGVAEEILKMNLDRIRKWEKLRGRHRLKREWYVGGDWNEVTNLIVFSADRANKYVRETLKDYERMFSD